MNEPIHTARLVQGPDGVVHLQLQSEHLALTLSAETPPAPAPAQLPVETRIAVPRRLLDVVVGHLQNRPQAGTEHLWDQERHELFDQLNDILRRGY